MKVICVWCKKGMGEKEPLDKKEVTHGMYPSCLKKVAVEMEHYEMSQRPIIDQIREINFKGAVYEAVRLLLTLGVILAATFLIGGLLPMD